MGMAPDGAMLVGHHLGLFSLFLLFSYFWVVYKLGRFEYLAGKPGLWGDEGMATIKSKAQQGFLFATKPKLAKEMADNTPNMKNLPKKAKKKKK